ncbi:MAG: chromate transporter [Acetobacteraceae bacterium]|nr:chromate transporter [Acetobacteraceae bacterium]
MPGSEQAVKVAQAVHLGALFTAFLTISLCGVGGGTGIVWARRVAVDNRRWITDGEFTDIVSLCQFMPGPNIIGIAVCVGTKMRGAIGAIAALCGFLVIPWTVGLSLGLLYLQYANLIALRHILGGIATSAAGLLIATGVRLLRPHRHRPASLLFAALAFGLITFGKLPLFAVLVSLVPLSIVVAGIEHARTR